MSVGKIAEKAICRSVFLTTWHCIFTLLQTVFLAIFPTGILILIHNTTFEVTDRT